MKHSKKRGRECEKYPNILMKMKHREILFVEREKMNKTTKKNYLIATLILCQLDTQKPKNNMLKQIKLLCWDIFKVKSAEKL
jgi:hypothetical protein